ncbi:hypothetical protein PACTADRAFT_46140 [Pachysolen tannophilus NRRL Y-2460]|uniref:EH domain-containing protein n=1 Tax=Pachysolen tannophilus NRRL Y-2460 TaxID=669874 RepID=A0A1E4TQD4_PACTA|nr:hypothetical protein PACTADRAFT_46140 [Pachysolen tannophilus NRRL Y-2460]
MRKDKNSKKFNEDKPWKHHNDANIITEQERKRYEGVWVSNKLLFVDLNPGTKASIGTQHESMTAATIAASAKEPSSGLLMHGLIVREIWKRSRLPFETLEKIYDLVDIKTKNGFLTREEFIVGMWLVDQCLYGRKLPKFVADEVWESVYSTGIISSNINFGKKNKSRKGL